MNKLTIISFGLVLVAVCNAQETAGSLPKDGKILFACDFEKATEDCGSFTMETVDEIREQNTDVYYTFDKINEHAYPDTTELNGFWMPSYIQTRLAPREYFTNYFVYAGPSFSGVHADYTLQLPPLDFEGSVCLSFCYEMEKGSAAGPEMYISKRWENSEEIVFDSTESSMAYNKTWVFFTKDLSLSTLRADESIAIYVKMGKSEAQVNKNIVKIDLLQVQEGQCNTDNAVQLNPHNDPAVSKQLKTIEKRNNNKNRYMK